MRFYKRLDGYIDTLLISQGTLRHPVVHTYTYTYLTHIQGN